MSFRASSPRAALALVLASTVVSGSAFADGATHGADTNAPAAPAAVAEARKHFQRGIAFYKDTDFRSALVEFQEAYRISPSYKILFNIAQTQEELGDFAAALVSLRAYAEQGGNDLDRARRAQVDADEKRLEAHVATVTIEVNEPDAELSADADKHVVLGKSPLPAPVLLNGGAWTFHAKKAGFAVADSSLSLAGGDRAKLSLTLTPEAAAQPPPPPPPVATIAPPPPRLPVAPPPRERSSSMTPVYVSGGLTLALAAGATVTGVVALNAKSDYDKALDQVGEPGASSARSKTRTFALATDILGGAAIAGAVVTVILYATRGSEKERAVTFDGTGIRGRF
jgi:hypothetical protein